jgi:hypothetical protein
MNSRQPITWRTNPSRLLRGTRCARACSSAASSTSRGVSRPVFSIGVRTEWNSVRVLDDIASS